MARKIASLSFAVYFFMIGCACIAHAQGTGLAVPVITEAFASKEIRPGESWKIYLNVSDPNGEMKNIYAVIDQPGVGQYPATTIRVKEENRKELSGYLYLITTTPWSQLTFVNITLTVQIQDQSGLFSQPAFFPLSFNPRATQETPPQGIFKEREIGPIMIRIKTIDGGPGGERTPFGR